MAKICRTLKRGRSEHLAMEDVESSRDNFLGLIEFRLYFISVEKNVDESFLEDLLFDFSELLHCDLEQNMTR